MQFKQTRLHNTLYYCLIKFCIRKMSRYCLFYFQEFKYAYLKCDKKY